MPHALTKRQREYLDFIRDYISANERSPDLKEIAGYFSVKPPTAHKMLDALMIKGYIHFGRSREWGFFIRLAERAGLQEVVFQLHIAGRVNAYGELYDFPEDLGSFPDVCFGVDPYSAFALAVMEDLPQVNICAGDVIIFDHNKKPQAGDICVSAICKRLFLIKVFGRTIDRQIISFETAIRFPIPEMMIDPERRQLLNWYPLAYSDNNHDWFLSVLEEQDWAEAPIPPDFIMATAIHLWRGLAA